MDLDKELECTCFNPGLIKNNERIKSFGTRYALYFYSDIVQTNRRYIRCALLAVASRYSDITLRKK